MDTIHEHCSKIKGPWKLGRHISGVGQCEESRIVALIVIF